MNGKMPLDVGSKVMCQLGDEACVLAPTHTYTIAEKRRDANSHMEVRVKNSLGEDMSGWYPAAQHFTALPL